MTDSHTLPSLYGIKQLEASELRDLGLHGVEIPEWDGDFVSIDLIYDSDRAPLQKRPGFKPAVSFRVRTPYEERVVKTLTNHHIEELRERNEVFFAAGREAVYRKPGE